MIDPEYHDAHNTLAVALVATGELEEAIPHFEKALAADPDSLEIHYNLGRVLATLADGYAEAGRFADAARAGRRALGLAWPPSDQRAADSLRARVAAWEAARPPGASGHPMTRLSCLVLLVGVVLGGPGPADATSGQASPPSAADLENALRAYRAHLARDPGDVKVRSNLGAVLAALGRYGEAIEAYKEALALAPADPVVRMNLALAYYKSADIPRAADELDALHREQPDDPRATLLLADCRLRLGEYEAVVSLLRPVEAADPENQAVLWKHAPGMALIRSGKPEEGQLRVERLMRGGDTAEAHYLLGAASFMGGGIPPGPPGLLEGPRSRPPPPVAPLLLRAGAALHRRRGGRGARPPRGGARRRPERLRGQLRPGLDPGRPQATGRGPAPRRARARASTRSGMPGKLLAELDQPGGAPPLPDASPLFGKAAPDVELRRPESGTFRLSSLRGQPVLLAFGSYTCPQFRHGATVLNRLHGRFGQGVSSCSSTSARPTPGAKSWPSTINEREGIDLPEARTEKERAAHAALARQRLGIPYEVTVDGMDGLLESAFGAFPSHAFLVDATGKVVYTTALDEGSLQPTALDSVLEAALR